MTNDFLSDIEYDIKYHAILREILAVAPRSKQRQTPTQATEHILSLFGHYKNREATRDSRPTIIADWLSINLPPLLDRLDEATP
jgi:hypothetical protein